MHVSHSLSSMPSLEPGTRVAGRFEVVALAGAGGGGGVYRAVEVASGRVVALKLLHPDSQSEERFAREAAVLASLRHPGVVQYLDYGVDEEERPFLVMEWLVGEDLEAALQRGPLKVTEALAVTRAACEALAAAHRQGVVHRDLKPGNLFLVDGRFDAVKLVDFGLALAASDERITVPGVLLGTPAYMAPEQVRGERVDARADAYSLGAVLFRCLSGQQVFQGASVLAVLAKVMLEDAPELSTLNPEIPANVSELVARLLAKDPAKRPSDAGAVLDALERLRASETSTPRLIPAVSAREQRVTSVVLSVDGARIVKGHGPPSGERPVVAAGVGAVVASGRFLSSRHQALAEAVRDIGGSLAVLADGTRLITVRGSSPAEQAVLAARCALTLAALRPTSCQVVATGRVVVSGSLQVGEVIDRAAAALTAMQSRGVEGSGVRLDAGTADLLDDRFVVEGSGDWRTLGAMRDGPAGVRTVLGRVTPCTGRQRELGALGLSLDECVSEPRARVVLLVAQPGMGKSRVLHEFIHGAAGAKGVQVLRASGDVSRAGSPFALASQLVDAAAGISDGTAPEAQRARLRAMVDGLGVVDGAREVAEFLGEVCGARTPDAEASAALQAARSDVSVMADAVRDAWVTWLRARCARAPTVVAVEDLQWGDQPSVQLLDAALDALADGPLMVVATARPEVRETFPGLWGRRALEEIHLGPLPRRAAEQVAREVLGGAADEELIRALVERSGGHPFHLEELVRAAAGGRGPDVVPDSVLGMLQARMDRLDAHDRRMLRAGSVFGEAFWPSAVAALLGGSHSSELAAARFGRLVAQEIVVRRPRSRFPSEVEYSFRHALVRDAAYATLPERDRAYAHRLAGEWLEFVGESDPATLARHFEQGEARQRAAWFYQRAAQEALDGNDLARASALAEKASSCEPEPASLGGLRAIQAEAAFWRGELEAASGWAAEAAGALEPGTALWFDAVSVAIGALGQRGRNDEVAAWLVRAASAVAAREDARGPQVTTLCRGLTQLYWGHYPGDLRDVYTKLLALTKPFESLDPFRAGWVHRVQAEGLWLRARAVDRCLEELDAACAAYERAGARRALCLTWVNSASLHAWSGEVARGTELLTLAKAEAERLRSGFLLAYARAVTGLIETWEGTAGAEETLRAGLAAVSGVPRFAFIVRVFVGWLAFGRGDLEGANEQARAALSLAVVADLRPAAMALLARVLVARNAVVQGVAVAREAVRIEHAARDAELMTGVADLALAEALEARGDHEGAVAALAEGYTRLDAVAAKIGSAERRQRFWARELPNRRVRELAGQWGIVTA